MPGKLALDSFDVLSELVYATTTTRVFCAAHTIHHDSTAYILRYPYQYIILVKQIRPRYRIGEVGRSTIGLKSFNIELSTE